MAKYARSKSERYDAMQLTRELKRLRRRLGWTQSQLGDELGVDWETISAWESRKRLPPLMAIRLTRALAAEQGIVEPVREEDALLDDVAPDTGEPSGSTDAEVPMKRWAYDWTVTFVLAKPVVATARCWFQRHPEPCAGLRWHFTLPMPPHPDGCDTLNLVVCDTHTAVGLYVLRKEILKRKSVWVRHAKRLRWLETWEDDMTQCMEPPQRAGALR